MYRLILQTLLLIAIISTVCICITKPAMHKSVLVYDSGYTLKNEDVVAYEEEIIPIMEQPSQSETEKTTIIEKIDNQIEQQKAQTVQYVQESPQKISKNKVEKTVQIPTTKTNTATSTKTSVQQPTQTVVQKNNSTKQVLQNTETSPVKTEPVKVQTSTVPQQVKEQQRTVSAPIGNNTTTVVTRPSVTQTVAPQPVTKILTAQEEEIAWNRWRSNLQNQIMKDSRLPIVPNGTVFKFSFTVDKYGKVTNVKTWSTNAAYTPYAIQYIAPAIRSYQGRSILNFPQGSNRVITDVTGGWKISSTSKYSTPQDYNDIEKVTR